VQESWPLHDRVAWIANLLLLGVAAVTLRWFIIQTKATRSAAEATRQAAEAAKLSAEAVINAERPWMIPRITQPDDGDVMLLTDRSDGWTLPIEVKFKNHGRSPAILVRALVEISSVKIASKENVGTPTLILDLPNPHRYERIPDEYVPGTIYMPGEVSPWYGEISKKELLAGKELWESGEECLCVKGYIVYEDTFKETRTTRFCYAYQETAAFRSIRNRFTKESERPREFRKCGPKIYNQIT
jgi:hypothetical protein